MENITLINPKTNEQFRVTMPLDFDEMITYRDCIPVNVNELFHGVNFDVKSLKESFSLDDVQYISEVIKESEIDENEPGVIDGILEAYDNLCYTIDSLDDFLEAINPHGVYINWDVDNAEDYARDYVYNNMSIEDDLLDYVDLYSYGDNLLENSYNYIHFMKNGGMLEIEGWDNPDYLDDFKTVSYIKRIENYIKENGSVYIVYRTEKEVAGIVSDIKTAKTIKSVSDDYYWQIKEVAGIEDLKGFDYWDNDMEKKVKNFVMDNDLLD